MIEIPAKYIIEIGLMRKRNRCALCNDTMDISNYNIQLCHSCRKKELDKFAFATEEETEEEK